VRRRRVPLQSGAGQDARASRATPPWPATVNVLYGTDPNSADTDSDGLGDAVEVADGLTDPIDPLDPSDDLIGPDTDPPIEADTDSELPIDPEDEVKEGRGCSCSTGPTGSTAGGGLFGALLGLVLRRRRR
jgi:MYXO-CTERM domain-containing protein